MFRYIGFVGIFVAILLPAQKPKAGSLPEIRITSPNSEERVAVTTNVTGTISGNRTETQLYVLVRALRWSGWWVQPLPIVTEDGKWEVGCYFGTPNEGGNERYAVIAVLMPKRQRLKEGTQLASIPDSTPASGIVTVVRK
jgi:hypothetical protein